MHNRFHEFYIKWIFHGDTIQNLINEEPEIEENMEEIIDVLNDFIEPGNGDDDVD